MNPKEQSFDGVVFRYASRHGSREMRESFRMFTGKEAALAPTPRAKEALVATYALKAQPKLGPIHVFSRQVRSTAPPAVVIRDVFGRNTSITVLASPPRGWLADHVPDLD